MRESPMKTVWTRRRLLGAGGLGLGLLAAACGERSQPGDKEPSDVSNVSDQSDQSDVSSGDGIHLVFAGWILDQNPVINDLAAKYSEESGIEVTLASAPEDIEQKLQLEARRGRSTWGGYEGHTAFLQTASLASTEVLEPWDAYMTDDDRNDLLPSALQEMEYEGQLWHFPFRVSPMCMIYRPSMLEEMGYDELPDNWEGIFELCERATTELGSSSERMFGITFQTEAWRGLWTVMATLTPDPYDEEEGLSRLDIPEAVEALEILQTLYSYAPADTNTNVESMANTFQAGRAPLMMSYILQAQRVRDAVDGDVAIGKLPRTDAAQGTVFWSSGSNILRHYGSSEEVAAFWLWLSNQKELYDSMWVKNGSPPNRQSMLEKFEDVRGDELDPGFWLANEMQENSKAIPNSLWIPIQGKHIKAQTDSLLAGNLDTPEQALEQAQTETENEVSRQ